VPNLILEIHIAGLKPEMSSWEVERLAKDFGWVMEAPVKMRSGAD
jgi:hypothetical protein